MNYQVFILNLAYRNRNRFVADEKRAADEIEFEKLGEQFLGVDKFLVFLIGVGRMFLCVKVEHFVYLRQKFGPHRAEIRFAVQRSELVYVIALPAEFLAFKG